MAITNVSELDVQDHNGSTAGLKLGGALVTATAAEINTFLDKETTQAMTVDGAITIKNGTVTLNKAGVLAATLANPTAGADDGKRLHILALQAQANTVTVTGGFGNGGGSKDIATFSGAIGDNLTVMAWGGFWYVVGQYGITLA
jgi:hypothetical protein